MLQRTFFPNTAARRRRTRRESPVPNSMSSSASIILLVVVVGMFCVAFSCLVSRVERRSLLVLLAGGSVLAAVVAIWLIDVNVPLASSHWRPGGEPASITAAVLATLARFAPLCAIAAIPRRFAALRRAGV